MYKAGVYKNKHTQKLATLYGCEQQFLLSFESQNLNQRFWEKLSTFHHIRVKEPHKSNFNISFSSLYAFISSDIATHQKQKNKKVEELSKGMQQKIQFIVTVIHNPQLLIFDEPFSGFDPINVNLLKKEILELRDKGATIIFSTHNMASVEELCDNIMLINKGQKVLEGSVYQIKQDNKDNSFEIVLRNSKPFDLPENFSLISEKTDSNGEITLNIKAENDINPNILINYLSEKGTIISYRELLPSMNDIFINKVNSL